MRRLRDMLLNEESIWNYWMRRPRNSMVRDVSDEIEQGREDMYTPVADSFDAGVTRLMHAIETASSIDELESSMERYGVNAYDVVADPTRFDQAVEQDDVTSAKMQLVTGLKTWSKEKLKKTQDDYDSYELARSLDV